MLAKLNELKTACAAILDEIKQAKANPNDPKQMASMDDMYRFMDSVHSRINWMEDYVFNWMGQHSKGHAPALKTATALEKYLKMCGMENDYEVIKPAIFAQASHQGTNYLINYTKPVNER